MSIYWSFWVPLNSRKNILNSFLNILTFLKIWITIFWKSGKNSDKTQQNSEKNLYFPIIFQKLCNSYAKYLYFSKNICRRHIKSKINQLVFVPQWFEYINQFKDTPISMWLKLRDNIIGYGWIKVDVYK